MHVHAGFAPPQPALAELVEALSSARRLVDVEPAKTPRFGWRRNSRPSPGSSTTTAALALDPVPIESMRIPVAIFGNVTTGDARRLVAALTTAAAEWSSATLAFSGTAELDSLAHGSVHVGLTGDLDTLASIARGVTQCVERLGFYVDRRRFDPVLEVARANADTQPADLQAAVSTLQSFRGREWVIDSLSLFTASFDGGQPEWRAFERVPLGPQRVDSPSH